MFPDAAEYSLGRPVERELLCSGDVYLGLPVISMDSMRESLRGRHDSLDTGPVLIWQGTIINKKVPRKHIHIVVTWSTV